MLTDVLAAPAFLLLAHWTQDGWGAGWWIVMMIGMVLFWALVIAGVIWLVRNLVRERGREPAGGREPAREVLDRRFAEGAIDADEYRERRAVLEEGRDR